jgi:hypothetical protein
MVPRAEGHGRSRLAGYPDLWELSTLENALPDILARSLVGYAQEHSCT